MTKTVTIADVKSWRPCWIDTEEVAKYEAIAATRQNWSALDIIRELPAHGVSKKNILWAVLRPELIDEKVLHTLACDFAQIAVDRYWLDKSDPRPQAAIDTKRRWILGKATDEELATARQAARQAAWPDSAGWPAGWSADSAWSAARADSAAADSAWSAWMAAKARETALAEQIALVKAKLEQEREPEHD